MNAGQRIAGLIDKTGRMIRRSRNASKGERLPMRNARHPPAEPHPVPANISFPHPVPDDHHRLGWVLFFFRVRFAQTGDDNGGGG